MLSDREEYFVLKRLTNGNYAISIKDAFNALESHENKLIERRIEIVSNELEQIVRNEHIKQCLEILKEIEEC